MTTGVPILIVDDEPISRLNLSAAVKRLGMVPIEAASGGEALEILQSRRIQMVLCDWELGDIDGPEVCARLRRGQGLEYTYFMLVTSRDSHSDLLAGLEAGADDFLTKPVDPVELSLRVRAGMRVVSLEMRQAMLNTMAKLAEYRDTDTGAHMERVADYSRIIADELRRRPSHQGRVDADFVRLLYATAPLHDIGKVAMPDALLRKKGPLTDQERLEMNRHAQLGGEILGVSVQHAPGVSFLQMAIDIARSHHERWDGKGYPQQLSGEAIPLAARIVAVADVYDALRSERPYKSAMTHEEVVFKIHGESGRHFDPEIVDAFMARAEDIRRAQVAIDTVHEDQRKRPAA